MEKPRTKDEMFIICLYDEGIALGDTETPIDCYKIGTKVGLHPTATKTICVLLAKANFIKNKGDNQISITQNGIRLVERLRGLL